MRRNQHLVVFAREPVLGRVKTRLGRDIGSLEATRFYRSTLRLVMAGLDDSRWRCWLALSPDSAVRKHRFWPKSFRPFKQGGGDIGQRMERAMAHMPPGPVVIIGTDVPAINATHIQAAFKSLGHHDVVFGPAADGGYWLVGARRSPTIPDLFSNVRWSSRHTLEDSVRNLNRQGVKIARLQTLEDIDDGEAYKKWRDIN